MTDMARKARKKSKTDICHMMLRGINRQSFFLLLVLLLVLNSCVIDTKPRGYCVKNCTKDTLFIDLTNSDTLEENFYRGVHHGDAMHLLPDDTISVYVHGKMVVLNNFYCVFPDSTSGYTPINETCYIYAVKKQIITSYSFDEIREKHLYDRRVVTKKDFRDYLYEYRSEPQ